MTPKEFIKTWFANIDARNYEALNNMMADNHQFANPMTPAPSKKDDHLGMIQMMTGAFDGAHQLDTLISEGDWVTAHGRWSGKHIGEFNGIPATGKPVSFSFIDMMHVVNGKVTEEYFELNPMSIMTQIGVATA